MGLNRHLVKFARDRIKQAEGEELPPEGEQTDSQGFQAVPEEGDQGIGMGRDPALLEQKKQLMQKKLQGPMPGGEAGGDPLGEEGAMPGEGGESPGFLSSIGSALGNAFAPVGQAAMSVAQPALGGAQSLYNTGGQMAQNMMGGLGGMAAGAAGAAAGGMGPGMAQGMSQGAAQGAQGAMPPPPQTAATQRTQAPPPAAAPPQPQAQANVPAMGKGASAGKFNRTLVKMALARVTQDKI